MKKSPISYIYIITDGSGACKIGSALSPKSRIKTLQTGSSAKLALFDAIPIERERVLLCEFAIHRQLEARWLIGEWFSVSPHAAREVVRAAIANRHEVERDRELLDMRAADRAARRVERPALQISRLWHHLPLPEVQARRQGSDARQCDRITVGKAAVFSPIPGLHISERRRFHCVTLATISRTA